MNKGAGACAGEEVGETADNRVRWGSETTGSTLSELGATGGFE